MAIFFISIILTLKWFHFLMLFTLCAIFLYETGPIQRMFSQHCGYWWPGALGPGQVATVLTMHPCVSQCWRWCSHLIQYKLIMNIDVFIAHHAAWSGVWVTKTPFVNFSISNKFLSSWSCKSTCAIVELFIFDRYPCSRAAATSVKYNCSSLS